MHVGQLRHRPPGHPVGSWGGVHPPTAEPWLWATGSPPREQGALRPADHPAVPQGAVLQQYPWWTAFAPVPCPAFSGGGQW